MTDSQSSRSSSDTFVSFAEEDALGSALEPSDLQIEAKTSGDAPIACGHYTHHKEVWYDDGNVVLVARGVAFKVHRTVLSNHSLVFKNAFAFPQPEKQDEVHEDCPVVHLSEEAGELAIFLDIFYHGVKYLQERKEPTWEVVRVMLLLGHKYEAERLYSEGTHQMARLYPMQLSKLVEVRPGKNAMVVSKEDSISIVNTMRTLNLSYYYHMALYDCCQLETLSLLNGVKRKATDVKCPLERLDKDDTVICLEGRTRLLKAQYQLVSAAFGLDSDIGSDMPARCGSRECERRIRYFRSTPIHGRFEASAQFDPLRLHCENTWFSKCLDQLCRGCAASFVTQDLDRRAGLFDDFPNWL